MLKALLVLKPIFMLADRHRHKVMIGAVCILMADFLSLAVLPLLGKIGAYAAEVRVDADFRVMIAATLGLILARYVFLAAGNAASHQAAFDTMYDLRLRLAGKIGSLPLGEVSDSGSAILKKTVLQDTEALHTVLGHYINDFLSGTLVPLFTLIAIALIDWRLALAAAAIIPFLIMTFRAVYKDHADLSSAYFRATDEMQESFIEYVNGIAVIKTFNRDMPRKLAVLVENQIRLRSKWAGMTNTPWSLFCTISESTLLIGAPLSFWLVMTGQITQQNLLLFILLAIGYTQPLLRLAVQLGFISEARKSLERVQALLDRPVLAFDEKANAPRGNDIAIVNMGFSYNDKPVLKNVTLEIKEGTRCAIVGHSGAGKTTLAKLVGRFWDVQTGSISIGGIDIRHISEQELYSRVSFVFQDVFLFSGSVAENLRLAKPDATEAELVAAAEAACAHQFISALPQGYDTPVGEKGALLSGGQKQRLSIARAILRNAPILILDEATAYSDAVSEMEIQKALVRLMKGRTVIMIAHRLPKIADADKIVVLDGGTVVGEGRHAQLLSSCAAYRKLWHDQTLTHSVMEDAA